MSDLKRISEESMNLNGEIFNHEVFSLSNIKFEVISNIIDIETKDNLILIHGNGKEELPYSGKDSLLMWFNNVIDSLNLSQGKTFLISHSFGATMSFHYYIHNSRNIENEKFDTPILLITGDKDQMVNPENSLFLYYFCKKIHI